MNRMGKGLQSILNAVAIVKERKPGREVKREKKKFRGGEAEHVRVASRTAEIGPSVRRRTID